MGDLLEQIVLTLSLTHRLIIAGAFQIYAAWTFSFYRFCSTASIKMNEPAVFLQIPFLRLVVVGIE